MGGFLSRAGFMALLWGRQTFVDDDARLVPVSAATPHLATVKGMLMSMEGMPQSFCGMIVSD